MTFTITPSLLGGECVFVATRTISTGSNVAAFRCFMTWVCPGDVVGTVGQYRPGEGTFVRAQTLHASVTGELLCSTADDGVGEPPIIRVKPRRRPGARADVDALCVARVQRIGAQHIQLEILRANGENLIEPCSAILRREDVRATEPDTVDLAAIACAGDLINARVVSLGDARGVYLSIAAEGLGVVSSQE